LPKKVLRPFHHQESILDIILNRLKALGLPIVLATTTSEDDKAIVQLAQKHQVGYFCGEEHDVLQRFLGVIDQEGFDFVFRICADNPFLSVELMQEVLAEAHNLDFSHLHYCRISSSTLFAKNNMQLKLPKSQELYPLLVRRICR
jgi:spore coat polysaccharide biosynthesis protein SpsF (cytidylyltransferase family)